MAPDQFTLLIGLLRQLLENKYTITGAADWGIFAVAGTAIVGLLIYIWLDLKSVIKDNRTEWRDSLSEEKKEREKQMKEEKIERNKQIDAIWTQIRECQDDCCPRGRKESRE